jgi:hypothetical protein
MTGAVRAVDFEVVPDVEQPVVVANFARAAVSSGPWKS